ncbi:MAG: type II toxin-antitoxin system VapC family toxin [Chloroflexota bacterium]|nr:MAG: type II toxin-antitoxin system VapC family toxin [Chloroflexota bacterium]
MATDYLLDTDILSDLLKRTPSTRLITKLAAIPPEHQFTSSITLGELIYGASRVRERGPLLLKRIEDNLLPNLPILPFDAVAARRYGELRATLERQGILIGDADLRIAAIALSRNLVIVTGNVRHFQRIAEAGGLVVENWLEERD